MIRLLIAAALLAGTLPCSAQVVSDYQLRPLMHWQAGNLAGWTVVPDITKTAPFRSLFVAGWLSKDADSYKEFMAGALVATDGSVLPVVNIRSYTKARSTDLYAELQVRPNLALASIFITTPVRIQRFKFRAGLEFETVTALRDTVKNQVLIGPRISFTIPRLPWVSVGTVGYLNLKGQIVIRNYLVATLRR